MNTVRINELRSQIAEAKGEIQNVIANDDSLTDSYKEGFEAGYESEADYDTELFTSVEYRDQMRANYEPSDEAEFNAGFEYAVSLGY